MQLNKIIGERFNLFLIVIGAASIILIWNYFNDPKNLFVIPLFIILFSYGVYQCLNNGSYTSGVKGLIWYFLFILNFIVFTTLFEIFGKQKNTFIFFAIFEVVLLPIVAEMVCVKLRPVNFSYFKNFLIRFSALLIAMILNTYIYYTFLYVRDFSVDAEQIFIAIGVLQTLVMSVIIRKAK